MREITLSADEALIERASERAKREDKTLDSLFREWLERYAPDPRDRIPYEEVMRHLAHVRFERKFTRDEMNEDIWQELPGHQYPRLQPRSGR